MHVRLRHALEVAKALFRPLGSVIVRPVRLPVHETSAHGVRRRLAGETAVTLPPISITAPARDDDASIQAFVRREFAEAQRKRDRRERVVSPAGH